LIRADLEPRQAAGPLPPSTHKSIAANGRNPLTGALLYFRPGQTIPRLGALSKASPMATRTEEMALGDNLRVSFDGARLISGEDKAGEDHAAN
jgi:hypothetical protein